MGVVGTTMYYVSDVLFCFRRLHKVEEDWLLNLLWIATHNFGNYFMMKAVVLHMDFYFERYHLRFDSSNKHRKLEEEK
jgi:hypothetical protein